MDKLRLLLCDDHPIVRAGLAEGIRLEADMEVAGEARDGAEAVQLAASLAPDVIVLDVNMPVVTGLQATERIRDANPDARVLAITAGHDRSMLDSFLGAGALGFVLKPTPLPEILRAIRAVARGQQYIDPAMRKYLDPNVPGGPAPLSPREIEVLRSIAEGLTMKDIGARLELSTRTLETYQARGMEKLSLASRAELIKYALQQGWLKATP
jgi:DNA-binding NarL/FixJ family response regulator